MMQKTAQNKDAQLTEGRIGKTFLRLTIPMIFGIISMMLFNLIDTFYIGRLGTKELAAISFTFPVVFLLGSIAMGLGIGLSSVTSRAIGEGDHHKVQHLTTDGLILAVAIVAVLATMGILTIEPLFRLIGSSPETLPLIKEYMIIWYIGVIFVVVPMVGNNAIRATGDTKSPSIIMMIGAGINAILDPLLIFGIGFFPRLEMKGAALATVIARATTLIASLWILGHREKMLSFSKPHLRSMWRSWKQILYIGIPAAGTQMLVPINAGIITRMISHYGKEAVAAFGVGSRIEPLALIVTMAIASVFAPFIGQNWGAQKYDRIQNGMRMSMRFVSFYQIVIALILFLAARPIAVLFNDNPMVISVVVDFLWIFPLSYGFQSVFILVTYALNAINKPLLAAILTVLRLFGLFIPLAYLGSTLFEIKGLFMGCSLANIGIGWIAYFVGKKTFSLTQTKTVYSASNLIENSE
ncbi:MATE family efflux transporter [bacterium]|nr:MATE family efflux transporter [bacterium]RQV98657.1 MAG: MATE family efflux transporter [bacterium]